MEIVEDRALILRTRNPHKYSIIPKSKAMLRADGGYDVAVYWGLDEARVLRNLGVKFLGKDKDWHYGTYLFTVDFCADGMDVDTGFTEVAEEHKSFNFMRLENGQFACQPNNRCLWYDQSLISGNVKFPDFKAAQNLWTVDGTRKWSAGDDWFYTIEEKNE